MHAKHLKVPVKYNKTDDEIISVFVQFHWTLKYISSSSYGKLFLVLFQENIYLYSF